MKWYTKFGLQKDPFMTDPFDSDYTLVNYSQLIEDLLYYTASGSIVVLEGSNGRGKTMMLRQIIEQHKGRGKVAYINGKHIHKDIDIERILNKQGTGFFKNILSKKPKGMILLLDDVNFISRKQFEKIKYYFDQEYIASVILTMHDKHQLNIPLSMWDRIENRHFIIPPIINFDALRIVRERFSDHFFLPDEVILKIHKMTNGNIRELLQACGRACAYAVEQGKGEVLPKHLKKALAVKTKEHHAIINEGRERIEASVEVQ